MVHGMLRDVAAGLTLLAVGAFAAYHAASRYELGSLAFMGPGMFPTALGVLLAVMGLATCLGSLWRGRHNGEQLDVRALVVVTIGLGIFAILIDRVGLVPAIVALVLVASKAGRNLKLAHALPLGFALAAATALLFRYALGINIPLWRWVV